MVKSSHFPRSMQDLLANVRKGASPKRPPVHLWSPPFCGDLDIRIHTDGSWHYLGSPIGRPELVRLFASILRREGDDYMLVTPVEKVRIQVDDVPFVAVDFHQSPEGLVFDTNVGDEALLCPQLPLRVEIHPKTQEPRPYILIREGLEARIDRKSFYRLVDLGEEHECDGQMWFGVRSGGHFFKMMPVEE